MAESRYQAFAAAAETRSLTKAAEKLGYTQSGVSHLIDSLEEELGLRLLLRAKSGTELTAAGEELLPYVRRLLAAAEDVKSKAGDIRGLNTGSVRIGVFSSVSIQWLPELLRGFAARYPGIRTAIINDTYAVVEDALLNNRVDCAFVPLPSRPEFQTAFLASDKLMVLLPAGDPLAKRKSLELREVAARPFIVPAEGTNYDIGKLFRREKTQPNVRFDVSDDYAAAAMVQKGLGYTILPELMVLPFPGIRAVPIRNSERAIGIAKNASRCPAPAVNAFVDFTLASIAGKKHPDAGEP